MQTVDESVCLVEFAAERGLESAVMGGTANRSGAFPPLDRFDLVRDGIDLLMHLTQQYQRLGQTGIVYHRAIVSSKYCRRELT